VRILNPIVLALIGALALAMPARAAEDVTKTIPTLNGNGQCGTLDVAGYGTASVSVTSIGSMTVTFYVSNAENRQDATPLSMTPPNSSTTTTTATAAGVWKADIASFRFLHACITSYSSGSVSMILSAIKLSQAVASSGGGGGTINGAVKILDTAGVNQVTVNGSGQLSTTCANCTGSGVSQVDTTGFTPASSLFVPVGGEVDDVSTAALSEGIAGAARLTAQRALHANLRNASGNEIGTASNPIRTDPTGSTSQSVNDGGGSITVDASVAAPAFVRLSDGASAISTLPVSLASVPAHNITNAGTFVVQENGASLTALQLIDNLPNTQGSTTSGQSGVLTLCSTSTSAPTNTNGQSNAFSCDTSGAIRVTGSSGTTQYAEDSASADAQSLVGVGFIRRDTTPAMNAGTAGDWAWGSIDGNGRIYTQTVLYNSTGTELSLSADATHDSAAITTGPQVMGYASSTTPTAVTAGDASRLWTGLNGQLAAMLVDSAGNNVAVGGGTQYTQDAALTIATTVGTMSMGRASAAAPTDVSADGDATLPWYLRSGAQATQPTYAGVLAVAGNGASGTGVQRVTIANDSTGILAAVTSVTGFNGTTMSLNTGNAAAGSPRVVLATDQPALVGLGIYTEDAAETAGGNLSMAGSVRRDTAASSAGTTGDNATINTDSLGRLWITGADIEDAAATAGGPLIMVGTVRRDAAASSAGTDGDNATLNTDASGNLYITGAVSCSNCTGSGASAVDDAAFTPAVGSVAPLGGFFDDVAPDSVNEGDAGIVRMSANRNLYVTIRDAAGNERGLNVDASGQLATTIASGTVTAVTSLTQFNGNAISTNAGVVGAGVLRVALASDTAGFVTDDSAFTVGSTVLHTVGFVADEASIDSVNEDDLGAPRMTLDRVAYASPAAVTASSQATSGCYLISAASTNSTNCKASAGNLYGIRMINTTATLYYLRLYNASSAPTCSSATGFIESIPVPASTSGAGFTWTPTYPINYGTGIGFCFTGGSSSTDNTNAATGVFGAIQYK
jgi:hypothetical protein